MPRSTKDILDSAFCMIQALLGTEVTTSDIQAALQAYCSDWEDDERESVVNCAVDLAYLLADVGFGSFTPFQEPVASAIHHSFVAEMLARGGQLTPECNSIRTETFLDRHYAYPLVGYPKHPVPRIDVH